MVTDHLGKDRSEQVTNAFNARLEPMPRVLIACLIFGSALILMSSCAPSPWSAVVIAQDEVPNRMDHDPRPVYQLRNVAIEYASREDCERAQPGRCAQRATSSLIIP